jgi:hypothetical protein
MCSATFWPMFSATHLVTLIPIMYFSHDVGSANVKHVLVSQPNKTLLLESQKNPDS